MEINYKEDLIIAQINAARSATAMDDINNPDHKGEIVERTLDDLKLNIINTEFKEIRNLPKIDTLKDKDKLKALNKGLKTMELIIIEMEKYYT